MTSDVRDPPPLKINLTNNKPMKTVQVMKPNLDNFLGLGLKNGRNVNMMLDTQDLFISAKLNLI